MDPDPGGQELTDPETEHTFQAVENENEDNPQHN
jgi:hypothetical protein